MTYLVVVGHAHQRSTNRFELALYLICAETGLDEQHRRNLPCMFAQQDNLSVIISQ